MSYPIPCKAEFARAITQHLLCHLEFKLTVPINTWNLEIQRISVSYQQLFQRKM